MENAIGSNFSDVLLGSTGANKLISGTGNDQLVGGSGSDILSATGASTGRHLFGDGLADGGTAGNDVFRILAGTNLIRDHQLGVDDVYVNSLNSTGGVGLTSGLNIDGVAHRAIVLTGSTHQTFVVLGTTASMTQAQAVAMTNAFLATDFHLEPGLIA
jgi:hypothetical protein